MFPLKCKNKDVVCNTFKILLEERIPKNLQTDNGTEFYNNTRTFQKLMKFYHINHYSTFSTKKASIVDRFIRTLKSYIRN